MEFSIPLNKFEKHDLILRLLSEGKTFRDICHIAHTSPRDIKPIAKEYGRKKRLETKNGEQNNQAKKPSISTQSFIHFKEGKQIDEVKVLLDIPFKLASRYWRQYLKSIRMFEAFEFYQVFRNDIPTLMSTAAFIKRNDISGKNIIDILRTANDVNKLNQTYYNLKSEIKLLEQKRMYLSTSYGLQPLPSNKMYYNYYRY